MATPSPNDCRCHPRGTQARLMAECELLHDDPPAPQLDLQGIKDSSTDLHDGRLLTLEDSVEFFNFVFELRVVLATEGRRDGVHEVSITVY
ncbi:MAG: hypothetical protein ACR2NU_06660 [Aeoliella sp.]